MHKVENKIPTLDKVITYLRTGNLQRYPQANPFLTPSGSVICSLQFVKIKADNITDIGWDLVLLNEVERNKLIHNMKYNYCSGCKGKPYLS